MTRTRTLLADVEQLFGLLDRLVDSGRSVIVPLNREAAALTWAAEQGDTS